MGADAAAGPCTGTVRCVAATGDGRSPRSGTCAVLAPQLSRAADGADRGAAPPKPSMRATTGSRTASSRSSRARPPAGRRRGGALPAARRRRSRCFLKEKYTAEVLRRMRKASFNSDVFFLPWASTDAGLRGRHQVRRHWWKLGRASASDAASRLPDASACRRHAAQEQRRQDRARGQPGTKEADALADGLVLLSMAYVLGQGSSVGRCRLVTEVVDDLRPPRDGSVGRRLRPPRSRAPLREARGRANRAAACH